MKGTILATSLGLGAVGLFGAFAAHSDLMAITPAWTHMFLKLAKQAGKSLSKDTALKVVTGVPAGAVPGMVGGWLPGRASRPGSPAGGQLQRWYKDGYECI
jgi:uncharacterized protein (DUF697 family)